MEFELTVFGKPARALIEVRKDRHSFLLTISEAQEMERGLHDIILKAHTVNDPIDSKVDNKVALYLE